MEAADYADHDATGLHRLVGSGQVSANEVRRAALDAADRLNPRLNALVEIWRDEPSAADGPLAGVPFVVKDIGLTAKGRQVEFGSRLAQGLRADADSDLMARFRRAGLVAVGRSAIPELGMSVTTEPAIGGPVCNPWDLARSAGGSSGGSAAAVAAGIVPVAHATDAGGSIRVPASCTGLVGLKPSRGRVAMGPALDEVWGGLASQFVLTRTVRDSAVVLDILEGPNVGEPFEISRPARSYRDALADTPRALRIGIVRDAPDGRQTAGTVAAVLDETARLLERLGHYVESTTLDLDVSWEAFTVAVGRYWIAYNSAFMASLGSAMGRPVDLSTVEPATLAVFRQGSRLSAVDLIAAGETRNQVTRAFGRHLTRFDVLLTPTLPDLPLPLGRLHAGVEGLDGMGWVRRVLDHAPFSSVANMAGTPSLSLPLGQDGDTGLPIGLQFGAAFGQEELLLRLAAQLEQAAPWAARRPPVWAGSR